AETTPTQRRTRRTIRLPSGGRQFRRRLHAGLRRRGTLKFAASAHLACRTRRTWVALGPGGRDGRPEGEHERDGPGVAEVRSQSPHAERTAGRTPPFPPGPDEHAR